MLLGVVLSSDKTNNSVMTGNHMAHPVLISLVNIDKNICSKTSLHGYMLLALLPVTKFIHKNTQVHSLLQDHLFHQALNLILQPLKTAATVGMMMNDPVGNLQDYKTFLKAIRELRLNGIFEPFWKGWPLSSPSIFLHMELLHHFHWFCWDHDCQWCIMAVGAQELDFRFFLIQTTISYHSFEDGISKLKQVTSCDHRAIQRYLVGTITGAISNQFLTAIWALMDFHYLAQAPSFSDNTLSKVLKALQDFHDHKHTIVLTGG